MAYFAELDEKNVVLSIMSVHNNELLVDGVESEQKGVEFCNTIKQSKWVKTSFNANIRKKYANIGDLYDEINDDFISPQPFQSWTLNSNYDWQAPIPKPEGSFYWDEETLAWVELPAV
jgi:hypothetical protein